MHLILRPTHDIASDSKNMAFVFTIQVPRFNTKIDVKRLVSLLTIESLLLKQMLTQPPDQPVMIMTVDTSRQVREAEMQLRLYKIGRWLSLSLTTFFISLGRNS